MPKELSKETIERINKEQTEKVNFLWLGGNLAEKILVLREKIESAKSEALRSFEEIEKLKVEIRKHIELLCVMHADGGHYISTHGMDKALEDAQQVYYQMRQRIESIEEERKERIAHELNLVNKNKKLIEVLAWVTQFTPQGTLSKPMNDRIKSLLGNIPNKE